MSSEMKICVDCKQNNDKLIMYEAKVIKFASVEDAQYEARVVEFIPQVDDEETETDEDQS